MIKRAWLPLLLSLAFANCATEPTAVSEDADAPSVKPARFGTGPAAVISDGRTDGNHEFYFLFPIVPERAPREAPFDADAAPTVSICRLADGACAETVAVFPYAAGRGSVLSTVKKSTVFEFYIAVWSTPRQKVGERYRATVRAYGIDLGFADIQLVRRILDLPSVPDDIVGVVAGWPLPIPFRVEVGTAPPPTPPECAACAFGPSVYIRAPGAPTTETATFPGDPVADYLIDIDDGGSQGADGSVVLNGDVLLAPRTTTDLGPRHVRKEVALRETNTLDVRLTGKPGSFVTVSILSGFKTVGPQGGTVTAPGSHAAVTVPPGAVSSGNLVVQITDTFGLVGLYPALSDRAYRLVLESPPGTTLGVGQDLAVSLPLSRSPTAAERVVASAVVANHTYWVSGSVSGASISSIASRDNATAAATIAAPQSLFKFTLPAASISQFGSLPGATAGSTIIALPQWVSESALTCDVTDYPRTTGSWLGSQQPVEQYPLARETLSKRPDARDVGIVLVHGWEANVGDCPNFDMVGERAEEYFSELAPALRAEFAATHPIWAFTYPSFQSVGTAGTELAQNVTQLIAMHQLSGVIIVAHSMGGLVSRVAAQRLECQLETRCEVLGIITLGTPHLGIPFLKTLDFKILGFLDPFLSAVLDSPAIDDLETGLEQSEEVPIFAWSGDIRGVSSGHSLNLLYKLIDGAYEKRGLKSDGLVPTYSASPAFMSQDRSSASVPLNHSELHESSELHPRIFADIRTLTTLAPGVGRITGTIVLASNGRGVANARVTIIPAGAAAVTVLTDELGRFDAGAVLLGSGGSGTITLSNLPLSCSTAPQQYSGLSAGGTIVLSPIPVSCSASWTPRTAPPFTFWRDMATVPVNGLLHAIGGSINGAVALHLAYDPATDSWLFKPQLFSIGLIPNGASLLNGKVYIPGGLTGLGLIETLSVYDPSLDRWEHGGILPEAGMGVSAAIGGRLYLLLGFNGATTIKSFYEFNPETDTWTTLPSPPSPHRHGGGGAISGKLYVVGGVDETGASTGTLHIFDPATQTWATGPSMPTPRSGFGATAANGKLFVAGAGSGGDMVPSVEMFDPVANVWSSLPPPGTARGSLGLGVLGTKLYGIGSSGHVEALDLGLIAPPPPPQIYQPGPNDGQDVWITSLFDYGDDYGVDDEMLQVGGWGDSYHALLRFELAGLPVQASSAVIVLEPFDRGDLSTPVTMTLHRITSAWDESTGWPTRPASVLIGGLAAPIVGVSYAIDITAVYNSWQGGTLPNFGIELRPTSVSNRFNVFRSSDYSVDPSVRPKLVIIP